MNTCAPPEGEPKPRTEISGVIPVFAGPEELGILRVDGGWICGIVIMDNFICLYVYSFICLCVLCLCV